MAFTGNTTLGKGKKYTQMDIHRETDIQKDSCPLTGTLHNNSVHHGKISVPKCSSILRALSPSPQTAPSSGQSSLLPSLGLKAQQVKDRHFHPSQRPRAAGTPLTRNKIIGAFSTKWPFYYQHIENNPSPEPPLPKA